MKQLLIYLVTLLMVIYGKPVRAQDATEIRFADYLERMPKPLPTLEESLQAYPDMVSIDRAYSYASKELMGNLRMMYAPIFEQFKKNIESGKVTAGGFSAEERKLMEQYKMGSKGLSEESQFVYFQGLTEHRPLISSGKLSWASPKADQQLYKELVAIEKLFDWKTFKERSLKLYQSGSDKKELETINDKLDSDLKKLPKKKVKLFEGVYDDVSDPDKAIELYRQYEKQVQKILSTQYSTLFKQWEAHYTTLSGIAGKLDTISGRISSGPAKLLAADLQVRTWEALASLNYVSRHLLSDALLGAISANQVEVAIEMYKKYKESME